MVARHGTEAIMAKRFFYVCAGLFLLVLSYHLGARSAGATGAVECAGVEAGAASAAVVDRSYPQ